MLRTVFKLVATGIFLFLAYKAASAYSLFKFADHMRECLPPSGVCPMIESTAPRQEVDAAMGEALSCSRKRQTAVESVFLTIPKLHTSSSSSQTDYEGLREMCKDWSRPSQGDKK